MPAGYTIHRNLQTPFRTASSGGVILPLIYDGIGTGTHTGIYTQPEYDGLGLTSGNGQNNVLAGGSATSFTLVNVTLAPVGAHTALLTFSTRTNYMILRTPSSSYNASIAAPNQVDFVDTIWLQLGGTGRQIEYRVTANSSSIVCKGFKLPALV